MSIRIVVDYRKLNSVTVYDPFYMPSTEEVIARLGQAQFLSKLDLNIGQSGLILFYYLEKRAPGLLLYMGVAT